MKLTDLKGSECLPKKEICQFHPIPKGVNCGSCRDVTTYNLAIDSYNNIEIEGDVEALAEIRYEYQSSRNININSRCPSWDNEPRYVKDRFIAEAKSIISRMSEWVVIKKGAHENPN